MGSSLIIMLRESYDTLIGLGLVGLELDRYDEKDGNGFTVCCLNEGEAVRGYSDCCLLNALSKDWIVCNKRATPSTLMPHTGTRIKRR